MSNKHSIQLHIPTPCHKDWEQMTPCEQGRFCGSCRKEVIDFTNWSDKTLYEFFNTNKGQSVCGRFSVTQLSRNINIPYQPQSKLYRIAIASGLVLIFSQADLKAQTASPKAPTQLAERMYLPKSAHINQSPERPRETGVLRGTIYNGKRNQVNGAEIILSIDGKVKASGISNERGKYQIEDLAPGNYEISVKTHFKRKKLSVGRTLILANDTTNQNITINPKPVYVMGCPKF